ncbi:disintegrin and metalloproteinase [Echinococcus multilocularis]|uniref:ADAM10 endopeptidase n=1 Tax=Echinococcus multilocularis TaxID=6211 RepID=A0A068YEK4_ECHMU|nr:disintegrin and metalloproteinase [Echinococcus multilocularis]
MIVHGASCLLLLTLITSPFLAEQAYIPQIGQYWELNYSALQPPFPRSKRSTDRPSSSFFFHAFGHNFSLVIYRDEGVLSPTALVVAGGQTRLLSSDDNSAYPVRGFLKSHPKSLVYGSVLNGIFRGTIALNASSLGIFVENPLTVEDVYFVEPAGNFLPNPDFHSVIYRANATSGGDVLFRQKRSLGIAGGDDASEPAFCGYSNREIARQLREMSQPALDPVKRLTRSVDGIRGQRRDQTATTVHSYFPPHSGSRLASRPISTAAPESSLEADGAKGTSASSAMRPLTRSYDAGPTSRVCNLYLQSDTFLWDHVIKLPHIRFNRDLAIKEITSIFTQHVQGAQAIYQYTNFKDSSGRYSYHGVGFRVDRVLINITEEDCHPPPRNYTPTDRRSSSSSVDDHCHSSSPIPPSALPRVSSPPLPRLARGSYSHENPFCSENVDVTNFLNLNSYINHDDFCLAYVFTYRDFTGGTLGLAWVAELGGSGGVCEKHRLMREGSHTVKKSLNTGVVTLLNYGTRVSMKISQLTFAHEMGHNLGAKHDDDFKEETPACLPSVDDPKGNYIMFASATGGDKENNNKFSVCSVNSIARLLHQVLKSESNCFFTSNGSFCGNRLTEEGEQCDCGFTREDCDDVCCYPKDSKEPCKLKKFANVGNTTIKVRCSPTAGECCMSKCQYRDSKHLCRSAGECHKASYCSGSSAQCPPPVNIPDGTPCMNHTRICKSGECLGSVCERIPGWQECSLARGEDITPEMMCYVACRNIHNDTPCISTIQLETDENLRKAYPRLAAELLQQPGGRAVRLQPGTPCDNYRGYCDVFFVCRSVEVEGPLARLHKLLFSPQVLSKVKTWITVHWWAMLLISFASVASMIIFMRLCSYSTPSSRTYHYHQQQLRAPPPALHPPPALLAPRPAEAAAPRRQPQGLPREYFVPPFRLKRRRTIDPVNGVERHVSELIPASSVPVPYHRSRGDGVGGGGVRYRPHPQKGQTKTRPVSVVVYPRPALPSHVRDLPSRQQQQQQAAVSVAPFGRGSRSAGQKRPLSFVVVGTAETAEGGGDNPPRSADDENLLLLPPTSGSPPPVYSPRRNTDQTNE